MCYVERTVGRLELNNTATVESGRQQHMGIEGRDVLCCVCVCAWASCVSSRMLQHLHDVNIEC